MFDPDFVEEYDPDESEERIAAENWQRERLRELTRPTLAEQIGEIMQVRPDGPLGRRILARVHELGF